jgi:CRISPR-associated protein Cmr2
MKNWEYILSDLINKIENHYEYFGFCKQFLKYTNNARTIKNYLFHNRRNREIYLNKTNKDELLKSFPFLKSWESNENILAKNLNKKYKNDTFEIFPFNWLKNEILRDFEIDKHEIKNLEFFSGIIPKGKLKEYAKNLLPYSFIIQAEIKLKSSYFSKDDDEFYLIQNPCLKEKVFKVPMIRGSGWKGALAKAAKEFINEDLNDFESFVRIFGTGSQEYREVIESLEKDENISDKLV